LGRRRRERHDLRDLSRPHDEKHIHRSVVTRETDASERGRPSALARSTGARHSVRCSSPRRRRRRWRIRRRTRPISSGRRRPTIWCRCAIRSGGSFVRGRRPFGPRRAKRGLLLRKGIRRAEQRQRADQHQR
jgi:hypothetical protein